jgi:hypothetical protein
METDMRLKLLNSSAVALVLAISPFYVQAQQKGSEERGPQATEKQQSKESAEPRGSKGSAQGEATGKGESKGSKGAEQSPKEPGTKGSAQTQAKEKDKGSAQTQSKEQGTRGTAQGQPNEQGKGKQTQSGEPGTKGSAQTQPKDKDQDKSTAQTPSKEQGTKGAASKSETGGRLQLSHQQRTNLHQTILKERNVNRVNAANISISVGTRVPGSVRLVALPASVISLVPQYRTYQYFVANDQICIVDPSSHEIVDVVAASDQAARAPDRGGSAALTLTAEEKHIIVENVEMRGGSTLALGSIKEGQAVPRDARVQPFPDVVVQKVPKVREHKYFTAEDRVAIVDPQGSKVQLVIDAKQ